MARERELAADLSVAEELMGGATLEDSALASPPFSPVTLYSRKKISSHGDGILTHC